MLGQIVCHQGSGDSGANDHNIVVFTHKRPPIRYLVLRRVSPVSEVTSAQPEWVCVDRRTEQRSKVHFGAARAMPIPAPLEPGRVPKLDRLLYDGSQGLSVDDSLLELVKAGKITAEQGFRRAQNRKGFDELYQEEQKKNKKKKKKG